MLKGECYVEQAPKTDGRIHFCLIGPPRKNAPKHVPAEGASNTIHISVS